MGLPIAAAVPHGEDMRGEAMISVGNGNSGGEMLKGFRALIAAGDVIMELTLYTHVAFGAPAYPRIKVVCSSDWVSYLFVRVEG